jgi:hypothetical protein
MNVAGLRARIHCAPSSVVARCVPHCMGDRQLGCDVVNFEQLPHVSLQSFAPVAEQAARDAE